MTWHTTLFLRAPNLGIEYYTCVHKFISLVYNSYLYLFKGAVDAIWNADSICNELVCIASIHYITYVSLHGTITYDPCVK